MKPRQHPGRRLRRLALISALTASLAGCMFASSVPPAFGSSQAHTRLPQGRLPRPAHVVIVIEENKAYSQILDNPQAPFLNRLAASGATLTHAYGVTHPSEPNYLALFSGTTQGVLLDSCPHRFTSRNLASTLRDAGLSFATYAQSMPKPGYTGCRHGLYARKHNPAVNWQGVNVDADQNRPFRDFPSDFNKLPTVSFVIPDLDHDMHSASIAQGDRWLKRHLGGYVQWARDHNSLLIVTWDEDNDLHHNHIPVIIAGAHVRQGQVKRPVNHYSMLRTLEAMYGLPLLGRSAQAVPITGPWQSPGGSASS
ncbi:alkaline phosphatase family protein [Salinisphaera sp. RV14]|uniref:alkaline phosphatase family protein n=1 Tax=Salinisphaera sp. RV14 TaxID=3454140 RepID=UPI003F8666F2